MGFFVRRLLAPICLVSALIIGITKAGYPRLGDDSELDPFDFWIPDYYGRDGEFASLPTSEDFEADGPAEGPSFDWPKVPYWTDSDLTGPGVYNVLDFGAVPDHKKDNSKAFQDAWDKACASEGSALIVVPDGTFFLGPVKFKGPCSENGFLKLIIHGTLIAPDSLDAFPDKHWISFKHVDGLEVTGEDSSHGTLDGQGHKVWHKQKGRKLTLYRILVFEDVSNVVVSRIKLLNSKGYHMSFTDSKNILVNNICITAPWDSPNTDGIHTGKTDHIHISNSVIGVGDDCISIGPGSTNVNVSRVRCGPGHGISVGSLGKYRNEEDVGEVHVRNCHISNTTNGVRIKTWPESGPSKAYNISFVNVTVLNVTNPIIIDQKYCPSGTCKQSQPSRVQISNVTFTNITGTTSPKPQPAVSIICSPKAPCKDVSLIHVNVTQIEGTHPAKIETGMLEVNPYVQGLKVYNSTLRKVPGRPL